MLAGPHPRLAVARRRGFAALPSGASLRPQALPTRPTRPQFCSHGAEGSRALRYAMSLPVCTTVSGIDSLRVLPSKSQDCARLLADERAGARRDERSLADNAMDGRFELYKASAEHEGEVGRRQHGFPSQEEVAL